VRTLNLMIGGRDGTVRRHLHVIRHDGVVHIVSYTEGITAVTIRQNGTPTYAEFRMETYCGKTAKMYRDGCNRITDAHPTCVQCVVKETPHIQ